MIFNPKVIKQQGQTLIESLVALGAAVLVLSAITVAVISALNNVQYTKNQNQATQYAQEALETMRQISQSSWGTFSGYNAGRYCLAQGDTSPCLLGSSVGSCSQNTSSSFCGQNYGIFVREVDIAQGSQASCSSGSIGITVIVSWPDSKCDSGNPYCHNVKLNSCLSNHNSNVVAP
jgi:Tfp pilus assembly protein PilV